MAALIIFLVVAYAFLMLLLIIGWSRLNSDFKLYDTNDSNFFSIIIPIRNEAENIGTTLKSILNNDFDKTKYEILIVNDHSTDDSSSMAFKFVENYSNVELIDLGDKVYGKKQAVTLAVSKAKGNIIICTDGDCEVPMHWIQNYATTYQNNPKLQLVFGPVVYKTQSFYDKLLQLELAGLVGIGAATSALGFPSMINGANFSYKKETFEAVNGYEQNDHIPSGDDEFLLRKVAKRYPKGIMFLKHGQDMVLTNPPANLKELLNQRKRWAGKWKMHQDWFSKLLPAFIFFVNIAFIAGLFKLVFQFEISLFFVTFKILMDFIFMKMVIKFFNIRFSLVTFLVVELIYPFYVVFFGIASTFGKYSWKERRF